LQELATAKTHGTKNKRMALQALRRKKEYEKQQTHLDGVLGTIQNQKHALENASMNSEVLNVVGDAARAMKRAHNEMDVDKVGSIPFIFSQLNCFIRLIEGTRSDGGHRRAAGSCK